MANYNPQDVANFGEAVSRWMYKAGLTPPRLSVESGVSINTISDWVDAKRTIASGGRPRSPQDAKVHQVLGTLARYHGAGIVGQGWRLLQGARDAQLPPGQARLPFPSVEPDEGRVIHRNVDEVIRLYVNLPKDMQFLFHGLLKAFHNGRGKSEGTAGSP